jgi:hypothetical protein
VDNNPPERIRPCDVQKLKNSLKFRKVCGIHGILNECLRRLQRRPLVHLRHLHNHFLWLSHLPSSWKEARVINLPKPVKDSKSPQNLCEIGPSSATGKLFNKVILKIIQRYVEESNFVSARKFGFRSRHSTTLQRIRVTDHVGTSFNNNISTAAVFLETENAFNTTQQLNYPNCNFLQA